MGNLPRVACPRYDRRDRSPLPESVDCPSAVADRSDLVSLLPGDRYTDKSGEPGATHTVAKTGPFYISKVASMTYGAT